MMRSSTKIIRLSYSQQMNLNLTELALDSEWQKSDSKSVF